MKIGGLQSGFRASTFASTTKAISRALERLSTGSRVSSPKDDPASFAQATRLDSQSRGLRQIAQGAQDVQSTIQKSQSSLETQLDLVQRMREIAVQATGDTLSGSERENLTTELKSLLQEFTRLGSEAESGNINLLTSNNGDTMSFALPDASAGSSLTEVIGTGTFEAAKCFVSGMRTGFKLEDMNSDGHLDIVSWRNTRGIYVLLGEGDGKFSAEVNEATAILGVSAVSLGDVDGDGIKDIAYLDNQRTYYMKGVGDGSFNSAITFSSVSDADYGEFADFNNDGLLDLAYSENGIAESYILLNDGTGILGAQEIFSYSGDATSEYEVADFNKDGYLDIAYQSGFLGSYQAQVFLNDRNGSFTGAGMELSTGAGGQGIALGDFNGDGDIDLAHADSAVTMIYLNNGMGTFTNTSFLSVTTSGDAIASGDVNGDGLDDIVTGGSNIFISNGNGNFTLRGSAPLATLTTVLGPNFALGDMNEDGVLDFVGGETGVTLALGRTKEVAAGARLTDISDSEKAQNLLDILDRAIDGINAKRGSLSAVHSRLDSQTASQLLLAETLEESRAKLTELDYAVEVAELTRLQTIQQAQTAVAAQANVSLSLVLKLLS